MAPREPRLDFEGLYRNHRNEVYRAALRKVGDHHEAEDVTQAAFLDAYRAMLRGSKPDLPRAWLLAIAENVRRRRFRTTLRRPREEPLRERVCRPPSRRGGRRSRRFAPRSRRLPDKPAKSIPATRAGRVLVRRDRDAARPLRAGRADAALPRAPEAAQRARPLTDRLASAAHPGPSLAPRSRRPGSRKLR